MTAIPVPLSPEPERRSSRWRTAFFVLLALNFLMMGAVGGAILRGTHGPRGDMARNLGFGPYGEALSPEDREALRKAFRERRPDPQAGRAQLRADMDEMLAALRAEPFEPARLAAAFAHQRERLAGQLALGQDLLHERLLAMAPIERAAFANRLETSLTHRRERDLR
ncbi:MAG: periplasmic heavy metal sensor [Gemmobacter sp.]|jgi:uncharacterized membrane protein|nr:periplasmic heavy metal sensor [Gemmobacter sp.]